MYGAYFDEMTEFSSLDTRDLDSLDRNVHNLLKQRLTSGDAFKLLVTHVLGVDSAGHSYNSQNEHIERKLLDT